MEKMTIKKLQEPSSAGSQRKYELLTREKKGGHGRFFYKEDEVENDAGTREGRRNRVLQIERQTSSEGEKKNPLGDVTKPRKEIRRTVRER